MSDQTDHKFCVEEGGNVSHGITPIHEKNRKLFRSKYTDIMIKVDRDVYHLDRLQLVLKSDYFENLFTKDFDEKNRNLIEIPAMDSDTFSTILDIIYGKKVLSVLNADNYVSLLMAMDYLQMEINLGIFKYFIRKKLKWRASANVNIFKLYHFIQANRYFDYLLKPVLRFLSKNLMKVRKSDEFLSLPLDHFIRLLVDFQIYRYSAFDTSGHRKISQVCAKWICHDVENRLIYIGKLVNLAKYRYLHPNRISDENLIVKMPINIDEQMKRETLARRFFKFFVFNGEIISEKSGVDEYSKELKADDPGEESETCDDEEESEADEESCSQYRKICHSAPVFNENNEYKLSDFVNHGNLHDIVIKVEEKIYQLHRSVLEPACGYFAKNRTIENSEENGKQLEETPARPNKHDEYFLADIDVETFDLIIDYLYFDRLCYFNITSDIIVRLMKAADILKIENLLNECVWWLQPSYNVETVSSEDVIEVLNFLYGKCKYTNYYTRCLCVHIRTKWPEIGNMSQFCSISCDILEDMLLSKDFYYLDDTPKILDICSRWIIHDVLDRYRFLPRIAFTICRNRMIDYEDYKLEIPTDLSNCSQQFVRDKLLEIMSSTSLIPSTTIMAMQRKRKFQDEIQPVFITSMSEEEYRSSGPKYRCHDKSFNFLNVELEEIAAFGVSKYMKQTSCSISFPMSATIIDDNLFLLCIISASPLFQVYNLGSKKFISLNSDPRMPTFSNHRKEYTLLNCRNEVYCCYAGSTITIILKYSMQMNRWTMIFSKHKSQSSRNMWFASDGEILYRLHYISKRDNDSVSSFGYVVEAYNFEKNLWIPVPDLPVISKDSWAPRQFTIINGREFAVLFEAEFLLSDCDTAHARTWREFALPLESIPDKPTYSFSIITHWQDEIFHLYNNKLYQFSRSDQSWELKREFPFKKAEYGPNVPFGNIIAIHNPT